MADLADRQEVTVSDGKRRLLHRLKTAGEATAAELARALDLTDVAVRQHLAALEERGLVRQTPCPPRGRGRPGVVWSLTELAHDVFPERHAELTVGLIQAAKQAVGESGLASIVAARADQQARAYKAMLPPESASLKRRVDALAKQRTAEGYMAEVVRERPGSYLLIEHHCPICDAAKCCLGLCSAELDVFQRCLGEGTTVERTEHLLSGGSRCVYRIRRASLMRA